MSSKDNIKAEEGLIGQVINDRYRIEGLLGRGNVGVVYRANDQRENRQVAIKIIKVDLTEQGMKTRFEHDADIVAKIEHPNAVTIYDHGLLGTGGGYFAMEFIEGKTLRDLLRDMKTLPLAQALNYTKQICAPVSMAHKLGVTHRDLKPENIMLPNSGGGQKLKVIDFGLAKLKEGVGASKANLTSAGEVMGTPCYMSPEQCLGTGVDERTDIYAIGIVLYEMLAGKPPFEGNFFSVLRMHMSKPIPSIREAAPDVPTSVETLLNQLLDKEKDKRPASVDEVLQKIDALEKSVTGAPQSAAVSQSATQPASVPGAKQPVVASAPVAAPTTTPVSAPPQTSRPSEKPASRSDAAVTEPDKKSNMGLIIGGVAVLVIIIIVVILAMK
jgi:eukaryotic-like serine/threonine-protein kinase